MAILKAFKGDITQLKVDVIVNAANSSLLGGGGVDGAIHRAAGPRLLAACATLKGCKTGDAKITPGYCLPAKYVIHTVGPVWREGEKGEDILLANCYQRSLDLAHENNLETIAFPCISTGVYLFPKERAAKIAIKTIKDYLNRLKMIKEVIFVCFSQEDYDLYERLLKKERNSYL